MTSEKRLRDISFQDELDAKLGPKTLTASLKHVVYDGTAEGGLAVSVVLC